MTDTYIIIIVFLGTIVCILGVAFFVYSLIKSEKAVVKKRFETMRQTSPKSGFTNSDLALLKTERNWEQYEFFSDFPPLLNLPLLFEQAGMSIDVGKWGIATVVMSSVLTAVSWFFLHQLLITIIVFVVALLAPYLYLIFARKQRIQMFETHLAQSLEIISRSLRAGHPLQMGMHLVSTEMPDPIGPEFGRVSSEQQMGLPLEDSLRQLAHRVPLLDLRFFVISILIHNQTGGDLAEVLDNLSRVIRERFKILGQVKALTAEGRLSGWVLSLLPIFVFSFLYTTNPKYVMPLLTTELGQYMLYIAAGMQILGIFAIRKIVKIKV